MVAQDARNAKKDFGKQGKSCFPKTLPPFGKNRKSPSGRKPLAFRIFLAEG
jgi:hypothetical protein